MKGLVQHNQHVLLPAQMVEDVPLKVFLAVFSAQTATMAVKHCEVEKVRSQLRHSVSVLLVAPSPLMGCHTNHTCFDAWHHLYHSH